jgi:hypothetical protein
MRQQLSILIVVTVVLLGFGWLGHASRAAARAPLQQAESDQARRPEALNVELVGQLGGSYRTFAISDSYVYSGRSLYLEIIDVSTPTTPILVGQSDVLTDLVEDVAVEGNYVYVAATEGLHILDVSDPTAPVNQGFLDTPGSAWGVAASGGYAYVADGESGLRVVDVSNPAAPQEVGSLDTPDFAHRVVLVGTLAYVADREGGVRIIDVSNPQAPTQISRNPGYAVSLIVEGNYAYVAMGTQGFRIVDVSNPAAPASVGEFDPSGQEYLALAKWEDHLFVVTRSVPTYVSETIHIFNVSNPQRPRPIPGNANTPARAVEATAVPGSIADIAIVDGIIYKGPGLTIYAIDNLWPPHLARSIDTPGHATGVTRSGDYRYIADGGTGLHVMGPNDATVADGTTYNSPGTAYNVAVSGTHAYLADEAGGLRILDVTQPTTPTLRGIAPVMARNVTLVGQYAYVPAGLNGLAIVDVSDPQAPDVVGSYDTPGFALSVAVSGTFAYVADDSGNLRVINVAVPSAPTEVGSYDPINSYSHDVTVAGNYVYLAEGRAGLRVIDVTNPTSPSQVRLLSYPSHAVAVLDNYLYTAGGDPYGSNFQIYDISAPGNPSLAQGFYASDTDFNEVRDISVVDDADHRYAYLAVGSQGVRVFDVTNLVGHPLRFLGSYSSTSIEPYDTVIIGDYAYTLPGLELVDVSDPSRPGFVADLFSGAAAGTVVGNYAYFASDILWIYDVSDPGNPRAVATAPRTGYALRDVAVQGDYAYVITASGSGNRLEIFDVSNPSHPTKLDTRLSINNSYRQIAVQGDYVYLGGSDLTIVDVSEPESPIIAGQYQPVNHYIEDMTVMGEYLYLVERSLSTAGGGRFRSLRLMNPGDPTVERSYQLPGTAQGLFLDGGYAYIADGTPGGLRVLNLSVPGEITLAGHFNTYGQARDVTVAGGYAYVSDGTEGLIVLRFDPSGPTPTPTPSITVTGTRTITPTPDITVTVPPTHTATVAVTEESTPTSTMTVTATAVEPPGEHPVYLPIIRKH